MNDVERMFRFLGQVGEAWAATRRFLAFWGPVGEASTWVTPLVAVGSVLALALLTGIAVAALATLLVALMALYYLLSELFGLSVEMTAPPYRG
ncbi:MAG: hypothetical protein KatS3mg077_1102 [Candidatus Binatia bacterium]|nr:MAG: hypothetical protein KatS3mg077_1102 [Candidatus Binatia bacterium]